MTKCAQLEFTWAEKDHVLPASATVGHVMGNEASSEARLPATPEEPHGRLLNLADAPCAVPSCWPNPTGERGPVKPTREEDLAISDRYAQFLGGLLQGLAEVEEFLDNSQCSDRARLYHERSRLIAAYQKTLRRYCEDFGEQAANRLDARVTKQFLPTS